MLMTMTMMLAAAVMDDLHHGDGESCDGDDGGHGHGSCVAVYWW